MKTKKSDLKAQKTTAENLETRFDAGEDVSDYFNFGNSSVRFQMDLPEWALKFIDIEAERKGLSRAALLKTWIVDKVDSMKLALENKSDRLNRESSEKKRA